jgi:recombination protein RecA
MGVALDVIKKSGAWLYYNGEKLGQGRDKVRALLEENKELFNEIEDKIRAMSDSVEMIESDEFDLDEDDDDLDDGFDIRTLELPENND